MNHPVLPCMLLRQQQEQLTAPSNVFMRNVDCVVALSLR
jgi:hypothetical protein